MDVAILVVSAIAAAAAIGGGWYALRAYRFDSEALDFDWYAPPIGDAPGTFDVYNAGSTRPRDISVEMWTDLEVVRDTRKTLRRLERIRMVLPRRAAGEGEQFPFITDVAPRPIGMPSAVADAISAQNEQIRAQLRGTEVQVRITWRSWTPTSRSNSGRTNPSAPTSPTADPSPDDRSSTAPQPISGGCRRRIIGTDARMVFGCGG